MGAVSCCHRSGSGGRGSGRGRGPCPARRPGHGPGGCPAGGPAGRRQGPSRLRTESGTRLFVVFVSTFGTDTMKDWAAETAARSSLKASDVLVAVAVDDRHFEWWVDDSSPLTEPQVTALLTTKVEPRIVAGDWAGTVVAAADGFRAELPPRPHAHPR